MTKEYLTPGGFLNEKGTGYEFIYASGAYQNEPGVNVYTLAVDSGSFALTGMAAGVLHKYPMVAASGSYTLTGTAVGPPAITRKLTAASGSFALTGIAASLRTDSRSSEGTGNFLLTGIPVNLLYKRKLVASSGSFSLTGKDVIFYIGEPSGGGGGGGEVTIYTNPVLNPYLYVAPSNGSIKVEYWQRGGTGGTSGGAGGGGYGRIDSYPVTAGQRFGIRVDGPLGDGEVTDLNGGIVLFNEAANTPPGSGDATRTGGDINVAGVPLSAHFAGGLGGEIGGGGSGAGTASVGTSADGTFGGVAPSGGGNGGDTGVAGSNPGGGGGNGKGGGNGQVRITFIASGGFGAGSRNPLMGLNLTIFG